MSAENPRGHARATRAKADSLLMIAHGVAGRRHRADVDVEKGGRRGGKVPAGGRVRAVIDTYAGVRPVLGFEFRAGKPGGISV
jgi:hypothetical protein